MFKLYYSLAKETVNQEEEFYEEKLENGWMSVDAFIAECNSGGTKSKKHPPKKTLVTKESESRAKPRILYKTSGDMANQLR